MKTTKPTPEEAPGKSIMEDFLARGYLPKELPFLFNTSQLAKVAIRAYEEALTSNAQYFIQQRTQPMLVAIAAKGGRRRSGAIPNPISQTHLVKLIADNWVDLQAHLKKSLISFSPIELGGSERTLKTERRGDPDKNYEGILTTKALSQKRLELGASSHYLLRCDIGNFYGSIYTHSISWALHGKENAKMRLAAKPKPKDSLLGEELDLAVRNGNDGQTVGLPIGPDTSRVLSEIIAVGIDEQLTKHLKSRVSQGYEGIRWVDDYLLYFQTANERDKTLGAVVESLEHFELSLNHTKTKSVTPAEDVLEAPWVQSLRRFKISRKPLTQFYDLLAFADLATRLATKHPEDSVILYASKVLWSAHIAPQHCPDLLSILWRFVHVDPRVVSVAAIYTVKLLKTYHQDKRCERCEWCRDETSDPAFQECITTNRIRHLARENLRFHLLDFLHRHWALEACWMLWMSLEAKLQIPKEICSRLGDFDNPLVALAAMAVEDAKLCKINLDRDKWKASVSADESLIGPRWMLAYELRRNKTLKNPITNRFFKTLEEKKVTFLRLASWQKEQAKQS